MDDMQWQMLLAVKQPDGTFLVVSTVGGTDVPEPTPGGRVLWMERHKPVLTELWHTARTAALPPVTS